MIKINDLRIGNTIRQAHATITVVGIVTEHHSYQKGIFCTDNNGHYSWCKEDLVDGIEITDEWLLNSGFDKKVISKPLQTFEYLLGPFSLIQYDNGQCKVRYLNNLISVSLKYVHQFQNIFYMVHGDEFIAMKKEVQS